MEGWTQRLFVLLVLAVIVLIAAFVGLGLGLGWRTVAALGITLFAALAAVQFVLEMRRDVRMLKNQALELSGYESEIGRRVDYLASLVERSGGAAVDEIAQRVRTVNHEYVTLAGRIDKLEQDLAELAIAPGEPRTPLDRVAPAPRMPAQPPKPEPAPTAAKPEPVSTQPRAPAAIIPLPRPKPQLKPEPKLEPAPVGVQASAVKPATPKPRIDGGAPGPATAEATREAGRRWREAVASDRLAFHLVPILSLPERAPMLYEAVMRLREDDGWLEADTVMERSRAHGLASLVERKTLYTAARMLRSVKRMGKAMRLVAPLSAASLADERGFEELRQFLEAAPDLREGLVLEITQGNFRTLSNEGRQRIGLVADAGFALSLGSLRDTKTDPQTLRQLGFELVRAPAALLTAPDGGTAAADTTLAVSLASHRIDLVATDVADEKALVTLVDRDVNLAAGSALAPPRLVKPDLLQAPGLGPAPEVSVAPAPRREAAAS